jgi:hypothetical protein
MTRSTTEPIVLETIYRLAGRAPPVAVDEPSYPGYPLAAQVTIAPWVFFVLWPAIVLAVWWWTRRTRVRRLQIVRKT